MELRKEDEAFEYFKQRDYISAERLFRELQDEATTSDMQGNRKQNLASCLAAQGRDAEALEMLSDVPEAAASDIGNIYTQALCFIRVSDIQSALESLSRLALDKEKLLTDNKDLEPFVESFLDLLTLCVNSSELWRSQHKNCKIIESLLAKLAELIKDDQQNKEEQYIWKKNLAHIMFMTDKRYENCSRLYYDLVLTSQGDSTALKREEVLSFSNVDPSVLRNLCVCYILTGRNRDAEQLIKEIESELSEEQTTDDADLSSTLYSAGTGTNLMASSFMSSPHAGSANSIDPLVHVNLAVGTLYCVKNNYEFGVMRIIETLEPIEKKLTTFSWNQAKRCILSLLDKHCRQLICVQDDLLDRIVQFLMRCETIGILVPSNEMLTLSPNDERNSVAHEARHLRAILLNVIHD